MTPTEIRSLETAGVEQKLLREIAAQLAELNAELYALRQTITPIRSGGRMANEN